MARLFGSFLIAGVALWLSVCAPAPAAAVDCAKPVAPCTACHSPVLTQNYAKCAAQPWTAPPEARKLYSPLVASPKAKALGKANYGVFCEGCHGPKADGGGTLAVRFSIPVADLTTPQIRHESDGELFWKLSHGWGAMPMWSGVLTDEDRWQLIAFIRSLRKSP